MLVILSWSQSLDWSLPGVMRRKTAVAAATTADEGGEKRKKAEGIDQEESGW